jgi:hypothetical protein
MFRKGSVAFNATVKNILITEMLDPSPEFEPDSKMVPKKPAAADSRYPPYSQIGKDRWRIDRKRSMVPLRRKPRAEKIHKGKRTWNGKRHF